MDKVFQKIGFVVIDFILLYICACIETRFFYYVGNEYLAMPFRYFMFAICIIFPIIFTIANKKIYSKLIEKEYISKSWKPKIIYNVLFVIFYPTVMFLGLGSELFYQNISVR